ncbi:MAG: transglutaminase-like domain-containing protein [Lachnospiraceae bacterium]|nr:transglutaminase-like domain-containing protein [Lachnospiraceae bacterium]
MTNEGKKKPNILICVIAAILIIVGVICAIFYFSINKYDRTVYGEGQQVECVVETYNPIIDRLKSVKDRAATYFVAKDSTGNDGKNWWEIVDVDNSLSEKELCSDTYVFNHYGRAVYKLGHSRNFGKSKDGYETFIESVYGVRVTTDGTTVYYTPYTHDRNHCEAKEIRIVEQAWTLDEKEDISLSSSDFENQRSIDLSGSNDGLYEIQTYFEVPTVGTVTVKGYVYKINDTVYTCCVANSKKADEVRGSLVALNIWTRNLTPGKYLGLEGLTYPTAGADGNVNNVSEIAKFSYTLVDDSYSDEEKVYAFTEWLIENVAYDKWRTEKNDSHSRAYTYRNYSNPKIFMWKNHVGVCWDYTNALAIMCREHGIPATSIDTEKHTWDLVYLNGRWESIDLCTINKYYSYDEKPDRSKWKNRSISSWHDYATYPDSTLIRQVISTNQQMWTYNVAYGIASNPEER